ncbi:MAG: tetratricopeptide repeat protein, partial [Phycisphaerales bacterium]|nr:tetratricopeptide repeat protein [Phycisphaerales bacterium]
MDHSIRKLVWVSGLLAAGSFVYVLVFSPVPDPRARARASAAVGPRDQGSEIWSARELDRAFRSAFAQCRYEDAERISREMVEQYTHQPVSWFDRALVMEKLDREPDAFNAWSTLMHQIGSMPGGNDQMAAHAAYYRGWALRGMGEHEKSNEQFSEAVDLYERSLGGREPARGDAYNLACYASLAGRTDRAIGFWERALATGYSDPGFWWTMDPDLDAIRGDDRFVEIA